MVMHKTLTSVGIDIGTSTTQLIFSALKLVNRAGPTQVPRFEFSERKILYKSPVVFTPINRDAVLDEAALMQLINGWFSEAGLRFEDIETGAIIITGETLKAKSAKKAVTGLSQQLGDFIVATAGPHLESVISAMGSGCAEWSKKTGKTALNIDIGGGTSNYAVFTAGRLQESACLNVGGRLIELEDDYRIRHIHAPAQKIIDTYGLDIRHGQSNPLTLERAIEEMAALIWAGAKGESSPLLDQLMQTDRLQHKQYDAIFISGGVGRCCFTGGIAPLEYNDIGPMLAQKLMQLAAQQQLNIIEPQVTVQATVIGAGAWTLSLSGSTVWVQSEELPLKNIPVIVSQIDWDDPHASLKQSIIDAGLQMDLNLKEDQYAIKLATGFPLRYHKIQEICQELLAFWREYPSNFPAIVLMSEDAGKVIGMELAPDMEKMVRQRSLIILDEIHLNAGDYIDLGKPLFANGLLPVTIKSLAFPTE